jgi:hypothetical protein
MKQYFNILNWIKNGVWIIFLILGVFGVIQVGIGMILTLIDIYHTCELGAFIGCAIIGILVLVAACVGVYGIVTVIRKHKELFNI